MPWNIYCNVNATISPKDKLPRESKKQGAARTGPQNESVFERNLIEIEPLASEILANCGAYYKETTKRNFNGTVLGYVTAVSASGLIEYFFHYNTLHFQYSGILMVMMWRNCLLKNLTLYHRYGFKLFVRLKSTLLRVLTILMMDGYVMFVEKVKLLEVQ